MDRQSGAPNYYTPYTSGDDTLGDDTSENDTDDSDESEYEDPRVRKEQDPRYAIIKTAGPNINSIKNPGIYQNVAGSDWNNNTNITSLKNYTYLPPPKGIKTSLVSIKSSNRDSRVFPTPYYFNMKLPRTYNNVTRIQLTQMSFPNGAPKATALGLFESTLVVKLLEQGIDSTCINTCVNTMNYTTAASGVAIRELGRVTASGDPLITTISIPNQIYTNQQLVNELTFRANSTPPLNIIEYSTFYDIFTNTRDISPLFNEPGSNYGSKINQHRYGPHTKDNIMNTYYSKQQIDKCVTITDRIAYNAYYFPILKETIATQMGRIFIKTNDIPFSNVVERILGPFEGLDSPFYYQLCSTNQDVLDAYRPNLTFQLRNVNQYQWLYNDKNQTFTTIHDTLHPSLRNEFSNTHKMILTQQLAENGLTPKSFETLKNNRSYTCVAKHLERNLSTVLGNYHFVSGYHYDGGLRHHTSQSSFSAEDLCQDEQFTTMFNYTSTFGRIYNNYEGAHLTFTNFNDYQITLSSCYYVMQSTNVSISSINGRINDQFHTYVSTKYTGILPDDMITNQTYLSQQGLPVSFLTGQNVYIPGMPMEDNCITKCNISCIKSCSTAYNLEIKKCQQISSAVRSTTASSISTFHACLSTASTNYEECRSTCNDNCKTSCNCTPICITVLTQIINKWYSCLPVNTVINTLTYRLGLSNMQQSTFNILSTVSRYTSSANLNYFMQINDEQGFNNIDVTMKEDYSISQEPTGQVKFMFCKILMNGIGDTGISNTLIQNPITFNQGISKLDRLNVKIFYDDEAITPAWLLYPYTFPINEWNATFQIDENIGLASDADEWSNVPTVPIPENPYSAPYLSFKKGDIEAPKASAVSAPKNTSSKSNRVFVIGDNTPDSAPKKRVSAPEIPDSAPKKSVSAPEIRDSALNPNFTNDDE